MTTPYSICIIDDDEMYQFIVKKTIQKIDEHIQTISFLNGQTALAYFHQQLSSEGTLPDIILLDINMPVMDGWEFMDNYQQLSFPEGYKAKVFVVSSSISQEDKNKALGYIGVSDFLSKPLNATLLTELFYQ